jgi:hypothetical protein
MKFLSDIGVHISVSVLKSNFYLLAILQPYYYFLNVLFLGTSHMEAKASITTFSNKCKFSFELYSREILLHPRPNSAVILILFLLYAPVGGQLGVKILKLVS